jgi:hypothetical protein
MTTLRSFRIRLMISEPNMCFRIEVLVLVARLRQLEQSSHLALIPGPRIENARRDPSLGRPPKDVLATLDNELNRLLSLSRLAILVRSDLFIDA